MDDLLTVAKAAVAAVMSAKTFRTDSDTLAAIEALEDACEREEAIPAAATPRRRPRLSKEARQAVEEEIEILSYARDDATLRSALELLLKWHDEGATP